MSTVSDSSLNHTFIATYSCYPLVKQSQQKLERGGKLVLPPTALDEIEYLNIPYPLIFKVRNDSNNRYTHAGVLEFNAEEGQVNIPVWLINHLGCKQGDNVTIESVSLPSATYCRIEPLTRNFAYISDVTTVLEQNLMYYFACLTEGDVLLIRERDQNQIYKVKIVETKPESAVNIFDCEMELDVSMPEKVKHSASERKSKDTTAVKTGFKPFQGQGYRLGGTNVNSSLNESQRAKKTHNGTKNSSKIGKRKNNVTDNNKPQNKRKKYAQEKDNTTTELIFIRDRQKEFVRKQSSEKLQPFQGLGHSLQDD